MATAGHPLIRSLREAGELDPYFDMPVSDVATRLAGAQLRRPVPGRGCQFA